jgi:protein O-GlcNAc transferase
MSNPQEMLAEARHYFEGGDLARAESVFRSILQGAPEHAQSWYLLGATCQALGKLDEAEASFQQALRLRPHFAEAHNHLGVTFAQQKQVDKAIASFQQALQLKPELADAYHNLGLALMEKGMLTEAAASFGQFLYLRPNSAPGHCSAGNALRRLGRLEEALASYHRAIQLQPTLADAHGGMGVVFLDQWKLDEAVRCLKEAVRLQPDRPELHHSLALALVRHGEAEEGASSFRQAVQLRPNYAAAHSALLLTLHYASGNDSAALFHEHRLWAGRHADPLAPTKPPAPSNHDPQGRLRIGYVSPDFREHPVAYFIEPILTAHDRTGFEVIGYADVAGPDAVTRRLQSHTDGWRSLAGLTDEEATEIIRKDEIDILVDLTGHTGKNRLLVFARKPAPIQVSHFGYPDTTGLATMDYRITDSYADPPGLTEPFYTEELIRLPEIAWCYQPSPGPEVGPPPFQELGHVTFASFNHLPKITSGVIALWSRILRSLPGARLLLLTSAAGARNRRILDAFAQNGVEGARVETMERRPRDQYLELHRKVDIGLDPFPYNGGVTTCDALWMGVPVVSLAGNAYVSRQGVSLLSNLGLQDLVAATPEAYVEAAVNLARDPERLGQLRAEMRERMRRSPLLDGVRFTRNLEAAYRMMWRRWCAGIRP